MTTFFFFQAEDGIRDVAVTGVQTCALPIWFAEFLGQASAGQSEFLISHGIGHAVGRGDARVRLLGTHGRWLGVTYPEDRPHVEGTLRQLVAAGEYPERLWG